MPKTHFNDSKRWRDNAAEMRLLAKGGKDAATRRLMNRLADGWEKMVDRAERRAAKPDLDRNDADLHPSRLMH
jgi:hypothetical protein